MADWLIWFVLAGAMVVLEIFTGTFYLLMIGVGIVAGGGAALAGASIELQLICAAAIGIVATYALRRSKLGRPARRDTSRDPGVNLDIGQSLAVDAWNGTSGRSARTMYRGALWDVELEPGAEARPGIFVIREVRGNRLIVANSGKNA